MPMNAVKPLFCLIRRFDVDRGRSLSKTELEEGLFLYTGSRLDQATFECLIQGISLETPDVINPEEFRQVTCLNGFDIHPCLSF